MEDVMKHEFEPYFGDYVKANDVIDHIMKYVRYRLFSHQEDWLYMASELGKRRNPMTRYDAYEYIYNTVESELHGFINSLTMDFLREYHEDNIDFDARTAEAYNTYFGLSEKDEDFAQNMGADPSYSDGAY